MNLRDFPEHKKMIDSERERMVLCLGVMALAPAMYPNAEYLHLKIRELYGIRDSVLEDERKAHAELLAHGAQPD